MKVFPQSYSQRLRRGGAGLFRRLSLAITLVALTVTSVFAAGVSEELLGCWEPGSKSYYGIGRILFEKDKIYWINRASQAPCVADYLVRKKLQRKSGEGRENDLVGPYIELQIHADISDRCYDGDLEQNFAFLLSQDNPRIPAVVLMYLSRQQMDRGELKSNGNFFRQDLEKCQMLRAKRK